MKINIVCGAHDGITIDNIRRVNVMRAFFLKRELIKKGCDVELVHDKSKYFPPCDHTIVTSLAGSSMMRVYGGYRRMIRKSTKRLLTHYVAVDLWSRAPFFDRIFTVVRPYPKTHKAHPGKFVYAGWGVDPSHCYPDQDERTVFIDYKDRKKEWGGLKRMYPSFDYGRIYNDIRKVAGDIGYRVWGYEQLVKHHGGAYPWTEFVRFFRKTHFFICTVWGDCGHTRLEAAACGALLVVHKWLFRPRTFNQFNFKTWRNRSDLRGILEGRVDIERNRSKALKNRWDLVTQRILGVLERG